MKIKNVAKDFKKWRAAQIKIVQYNDRKEREKLRRKAGK